MKINKEVLGEKKRNLENNTRRSETKAALIHAKTVNPEADIKQDNLQWTGVNKHISSD